MRGAASTTEAPDVPATGLVGSVLAVCRRAERAASMRKPRVEAIELDVERGVVGDVHEGPGDRQVALIAAETLDELRHATGTTGGIDCGDMGENLVLAGVAPAALLPGTRLEFAGGAALELTFPRTPCVELEDVAPGLLRASVGRCGLFARVLVGGTVTPGDRVRVMAGVSTGAP